MDLKESIRNQTDVSLSLAKHVSLSESKDSNLVFSPLSIHVVLGLIAAGSKGQTQTQLLSFLNSKSTDDLNSLSSQLVSLVFADGGPSGGPRLSFANGVWVDQSLSLKPSFKQVVDTVYKAASSHVDFQTKGLFSIDCSRTPVAEAMCAQCGPMPTLEFGNFFFRVMDYPKIDVDEM